MGLIVDIFIDSLVDVIKLLPFLFLTYLFLEWLEQSAGHSFESLLEKNHRFGPIIGGVLGIVPSCGFSSAAASLYTTHIISAGTLIAIYLSTSDEMLSIMISRQVPLRTIAPILGIKVVVAIIGGMIAEIFASHPKPNIDEFCEREHDTHSHGILHSAIQHTIQIFIWLFIITFVFNGIVQLIGEDTIVQFVNNHQNSSVLVCTFVGMVPSCASSILLTTMYLDNIIPFASLCAGLLANAGTGMLVLFRVNPKIKDNIKIISYVWVISLIAGFIIQLLI